MTRSHHDRVADILDACRRLSEVAELGRAEYDRNWIVQSAVERLGEIPEHWEVNLSARLS